MLKANTVVSITREYGSGGKEIAELLAKKMGVRCYDRQVVYLAAEKMGEGNLDVAALMEEAKKPGRDFFAQVGETGMNEVLRQNQQFIQQSKVIYELAEAGSGVFLGRCSDFVLEKFPEHYSFFIYADEEQKKKRLETHYDEKTLKELKKVDADRIRYYKRYTGRAWGEPQNYHMMIHAGKCDFEAAADLIYQYIEKKQAEKK